MKSFSLTGWCPYGIPEGKAGGCNLKIFFGVVLVITLFLTSIAGATVPRLMNLQGRLTDPTSGQPIPDDGYMMVFAIYETPVNGSPLWAETTSVPVQAGTFNVYLTPPDPVVPPDPIFNDTGVRYLGIRVLPDPELSPRIRLATVPYSFKVRTVEGALGGNIFGDLQLHSTLTVGDLSGDVGRLEITDGASTKIVADGATGKVGIGTTSPFDDLHIFDNILGAAVVLDAGGPKWWQVSSFGQTFYITQNDSNSGLSRLFIESNGNTALVPTGGNVGIGTTTPDAQLTVYDDNTLGERGLRIDKVLGVTTANSFALSAVNTTGPAAGFANFGGFFSAFANVGPGGGDKYAVRGAAQGTGNRNIAGYFFADGATDNYGLYVDGGLGYFSSNVGIGTASPLSQLHLESSNSISNGIRIYNTSASGDPNIHFLTDGVFQYTLGVDNDEGDKLQISAGSTLNSSELLTLTPAGHVGIGTTSPQGALDVSSTTGAFIVPRMTTAQRNLLTAVDGMIIYNTDAAAGGRFEFRENGVWVTK